jgi:hypothetical protein
MLFIVSTLYNCTNPVPKFVNVKGAQKLIQRNRYRQPMYPSGPERFLGSLNLRIQAL